MTARRDPHSLVAALDRAAIARLAGARVFERGEEYVGDGRVRNLTVFKGKVAARVEGTNPYEVEISLGREGRPSFRCTCPAAEGGTVCKHAVAAVLAARAGVDHGRERPAGIEDVRGWLSKLDHERLAALLMEEANADPGLLDRLRLRASAAHPGGVNLATFHEVIDAAVHIRGFVDYCGAFDWAQGVELAIDSVASLLREGHAAETVELTEHFLAALESNGGAVDDSDGHLAGLLERLQRLHHEACLRSRPDPEKLAERLLRWELETSFDVFYGAAETYADVLGERGLARYRELAERHWKRLPQLGPGDQRASFSQRFAITYVMETLARRDGDVDAQVAVIARDLSSAYSFLRIAEILDEAGRADQAMDWAERGLEAFPEKTDSRLREFLATAYARRERHDAALELMWDEFVDRPSVDAYGTVRHYAQASGEWPARRERALAMLRRLAAEARAQARERGWGLAWQGDHSLLVRILLMDGDEELAWHEAREGGCSEELWLELARRRKRGHPEDALEVLMDRVEPTIERKTKADYEHAVGLLSEIRELMDRVGLGGEFPSYLEDIRARHARKRNLVALLDRAAS